MAPIHESLLFLLETVFADLPEDARLLCVGVGTGTELAHLARRFPRWRFLALDPSPRMIDACRARAEREGFAGRCEFHAGLVETLPDAAAFDGATCLLVSQFLLDCSARTAFFFGLTRRRALYLLAARARFPSLRSAVARLCANSGKVSARDALSGRM